MLASMKWGCDYRQIECSKQTDKLCVCVFDRVTEKQTDWKRWRGREKVLTSLGITPLTAEKALKAKCGQAYFLFCNQPWACNKDESQVRRELWMCEQYQVFPNVESLGINRKKYFQYLEPSIRNNESRTPPYSERGSLNGLLSSPQFWSGWDCTGLLGVTLILQSRRPRKHKLGRHWTLGPPWVGEFKHRQRLGFAVAVIPKHKSSQICLKSCL